MKLSLLSLMFFACVSAQAIVGGQNVLSTDLEAVSTVGLSNGCTGTLITKKHVLTAAHCINSDDQIFIVFGLSFRSGSRVLVGSIFRHEGYTGLSSGGRLPSAPTLNPVHDIALLKMVAEAPEGFEPTELTSSPLVKGDELILAGFGQTDPVTGAGFGVLRKVKTFFDFYNQNALEIVFGPTPGMSACRGDSGGPMYVDEGGVLKLIGVTSRGFIGLGPCSGSGNYTDVEAHLDWIEEGMNVLGE